MARAKRPKPPRQKLGSFWVDTAQVLVGEPCHLLPDPDDGDERPKPPLTYTEAMELFTRPKVGVTKILDSEFTEYGPEPRAAVLEAGTDPCALIVRTGCDGWCPVYLEFDRKGEPRRIVIDIGKVKP